MELGGIDQSIGSVLTRTFPRENVLVAKQAIDGAAALRSTPSSARSAEFRKRFGEFIGGVFFGPLLTEAQKSVFKTKYSSGGHAEEVFQGQMALELSKKTGRVVVNGFARHLLDAAERRAGVAAGSTARIDS